MKPLWIAFAERAERLGALSGVQAFKAAPQAMRVSAITLRLRRFLDVCGSVDFSAKLTPSGGRMTFANPPYEQKPSEWKMCCRAGRGPVEAAMTFVAARLKEIGG